MIVAYLIALLHLFVKKQYQKDKYYRLIFNLTGYHIHPYGSFLEEKTTKTLKSVHEKHKLLLLRIVTSKFQYRILFRNHSSHDTMPTIHTY